MEYKSIRQTLAMSSSTLKPQDAAEKEYEKQAERLFDVSVGDRIRWS